MIKLITLLLILMPFNAYGDKAPFLNDKLPDFSLKDNSGRIHTLYGYRGKIVMLFTLGHG